MSDVEPEFEDTAKAVLDYLHHKGYPDAVLMPDAGAGLYDVESEGAIAEITVAAPPARPDVQRLDGVARQEDRPALYFSLRGFTTSAKEWADNVRIALFAVDGSTGEVTPVNGRATEIDADPAEPAEPEDALRQAASRAVEVGKTELDEAHDRDDMAEETKRRVEEARKRKAMRRNLLG